MRPASWSVSRELAAEEGVDAGAVESVYRRIIAASKSVQGVTVAFQGEPGAYSQQAAFNFFGPAVETRPYETLEDVFSAVERGDAGFAVVPVENSLEGSISQTYDLLLESPLKVCGETQPARLALPHRQPGSQSGPA